MVGALFAAVGSGLQARDDFAGYRSVLDELGVPTVRASLKLYVAHFISLMPAAKIQRDHPHIARANPEFQAKLQDLTRATNDAGTTLMEDFRTLRQKARGDERASAFKRKAMYWSLILFGSLALFAAALVALIGAA